MEKATNIHKKDAVVVVHGILQRAITMLPICAHLHNHGYEVLNLDYPSTKAPIQELARMIADQINDYARSVTGSVHLVGYSMGGLVIRALLKERCPENLGRVVMIGTPNHGSEVADFLRGLTLFKKIYGPSGQQLITDQRDFADIFLHEGFDLGIIAGDASYNPFFNKIINRPSDGKVSVESTKLACASDHLVVHCNHTMLLYSNEVWNQTTHFLRNGKFENTTQEQLMAQEIVKSKFVTDILSRAVRIAAGQLQRKKINHASPLGVDVNNVDAE